MLAPKMKKEGNSTSNNNIKLSGTDLVEDMSGVAGVSVRISLDIDAKLQPSQAKAMQRFVLFP